MSTVITSADWYANPTNHVIVLKGGVVFTSLTETCAPPQTFRDIERDPNWTSVDEPFQLRENLNRFPQFAFIPKNVQLAGPLLGRLADCTLAQDNQGRYGLDREVLKSWFWLEDTLSAAIAALSHQLVFPMSVDVFPYPRHDAKYARAFKTRHRAILCLAHAQKSFLVMIGLFSMLFSFRAERHFHHTVVPGSDRHQSVQALLRAHANLSDATIQDLVDMHAVLGERIGVVVVYDQCAWFAILWHALCYANVGFWIRWGALTKPQAIQLRKTPPPLLRTLVPDPKMIAQCFALVTQRDLPFACSEQALEEDQRAARAAPDPFSFLRSRERKENAKREKASPAELNLWGQRQDLGTWTRKSKVFHWPKIAGVRTRTRVDRSQLQHVWHETQYGDDRTAGQRKYSAVFDEWDVCTEFDASAEERSMTDPTLDVSPDLQTALPRRQQEALVAAPRPVSSAHNDQGILEAHATAQVVEGLDMPMLDTLLLQRYGFLVDALGEDIERGSFTVPTETMDMAMVCKILMEKDVSPTPVAEPAARYIVTALVRGWPFPDAYWDVRNCHLRDRNPGFFNVSPLRLMGIGRDAVLRGYTVNPTTQRYRRPWLLFFESSVGVAQCLREAWGPSLEDAVVKACENGFRIHLFLVVKRDQLPPPERLRPRFDRRRRQQGHVPCHFDFNAYQSIVALMMEEDRLKAAVLRGGILSRICAPYVSIEDVSDGPSDSAVRHGFRWTVEGFQSDVVFVEDCVSQDEIELLCGHVYIDNDGRQEKVVSFFPAPDVWDKSAYNLPAWCHSAEAKYMSLMADLQPNVDPQDPTPVPVPARNKQWWKSHMRHYLKDTSAFVARVEEACDRFLLSLA